MDKQVNQSLETPRFEDGKALVIAGVKGRYSKATVGDIPQLWKVLDDCIDEIPARVGGFTYGICFNAKDGEFDYIAGVEVSAKDQVPSNFHWTEVPARRYAVFTHRGIVMDLEQTYTLILTQWLPTSGFKVAGADFERYSENFDAVKGTGVVEIWLPIERV